MSLKGPRDPLIYWVNLGASRPLQCLWCWTHEVLGGRGIVQYQKNFKRQSLAGKVLPDFRDKASVEPIQRMGSCCTTQRLVAGVTFSLQSLGVSSFIDKGKGSPDQEFDYVCTKWCLKSWCSLLFLTNRCLLWHFFPRTLSPALKTCSGRYSFSMVFLMMPGNLFAASWLAEAASPGILTLFSS